MINSRSQPVGTALAPTQPNPDAVQKSKAPYEPLPPITLEVSLFVPFKLRGEIVVLKVA